MPDKEKKSDFVVKDRRLFSADGELRQDVVEAEELAAERERAASEAQQRTNQERSTAQQATEPQAEAPAADEPTTAEQQASADAYSASTRQLDDRMRKELLKQGRGESVKDLEMTFEKFVASLYMTALMQLGLAAPQGEKPVLDIFGARQTIDILGLLSDKTKGNLTSTEEGTLRNVLYELRMAYLEVTNMLANASKDGVAPAK